ncbi:MAG: histidine triad nucleotide-binding protein [Thermodesulfobacteriota bacterium]|nr:histidine triad nucleotide-binding protein [Thermodesulfobacteriota bacterium]
MEDCIFCKIVRGEIPSTVVYENDEVLAFEDVNPMAPVHVVVIPKRHIATLMDVKGDEMETMGSMLSVVQEVAKIKGIDEKGFRMVINCNEEGGQLVFHLHIHVLGGKRLRDELD